MCKFNIFCILNINKLNTACTLRKLLTVSMRTTKTKNCQKKMSALSRYFTGFYKRLLPFGKAVCKLVFASLIHVHKIYKEINQNVCHVQQPLINEPCLCRYPYIATRASNVLKINAAIMRFPDYGKGSIIQVFADTLLQIRF